MRLSFEFFKFFKFCICPVFHDWKISYDFHNAVSIYLRWFRSIFFMIVLKVWYSFCFLYYVRNLALVGNEAFRFFICQLRFTASVFFPVITSLLRILIIDLIFAMQLQLIYFCWMFYDIYGSLENVLELKEGNIYQSCWRRSLKKVGWTRWCFTRCFFCDF